MGSMERTATTARPPSAATSIDVTVRMRSRSLVTTGSAPRAASEPLPAPSAGPEAGPGPDAEPILRIRGVDFYYGEKQALFDVDEAVDFVADGLPFEISARISYDDVRALLRFHLEHVAAAGAPAERWNAGRSRLVIVDDEEGAEVLMQRALEAGLDLTPDDVAAVLAGELAYFEAIGAVGPPVPEPLELLLHRFEADQLPPAA